MNSIELNFRLKRVFILTYLKLRRTSLLLRQLATLCKIEQPNELLQIDTFWARVFTLPDRKLINIIDFCLLILLLADKQKSNVYCKADQLSQIFSRYKLDIAFRLSHKTTSIPPPFVLSGIESYFAQNRFLLITSLCSVKCPHLSLIIRQRLYDPEMEPNDELIVYWENIDTNEIEKLFINSANVIIPETLALQLENYYG
jgi:hypothetical protein